jgi:hypothetical protein
MRRVIRLSSRFVLVVLSACGGGSGAALAPGAAAPTPPAPAMAPPTPAPTDWKGLFDSASQPSNVLPVAVSFSDVLRQEPDCSRVITFGEGAFTSPGEDETAFLLACGATQRVVIASGKALVASLDVPEDTLEEAGDLDWDGRRELLLIGHAGPRITVRVLHAAGGNLSPIYDYSATPDACTHVVIFYRFVQPKLEYRVDTEPKRCTP